MTHTDTQPEHTTNETKASRHTALVVLRLPPHRCDPISHLRQRHPLLCSSSLPFSFASTHRKQLSPLHRLPPSPSSVSTRSHAHTVFRKERELTLPSDPASKGQESLLTQQSHPHLHPPHHANRNNAPHPISPQKNSGSATNSGDPPERSNKRRQQNNVVRIREKTQQQRQPNLVLGPPLGSAASSAPSYSSSALSSETILFYSAEKRSDYAREEDDGMTTGFYSAGKRE